MARKLLACCGWICVQSCQAAHDSAPCIVTWCYKHLHHRGMATIQANPMQADALKPSASLPARQASFEEDDGPLLHERRRCAGPLPRILAFVALLVLLAGAAAIIMLVHSSSQPPFAVPEVRCPKPAWRRLNKSHVATVCLAEILGICRRETSLLERQRSSILASCVRHHPQIHGPCRGVGGQRPSHHHHALFPSHNHDAAEQPRVCRGDCRRQRRRAALHDRRRCAIYRGSESFREYRIARGLIRPRTRWWRVGWLRGGQHVVVGTPAAIVHCMPAWWRGPAASRWRWICWEYAPVVGCPLKQFPHRSHVCAVCDRPAVSNVDKNPSTTPPYSIPTNETSGLPMDCPVVDTAIKFGDGAVATQRYVPAHCSSICASP